MFATRLRFLIAPLLVLALATAALAAEDCGNCVDDDADQAIDRNDPDCTPAANGNNQGIGDESAGKLLTACAKTTQKAGYKLVLGTMKKFFKCLEAASTCIHKKPGNQKCQDKAIATCTKSLGGFDAAAAKLQAAVVAKCGEDDSDALTDLLASAGLGFASEQVPCQTDGGPGTFTSVADIGTCIALQHSCRAQTLAGIANPRARELLRFVGRPDNEFPCIEKAPQIDGGGGNVPGDHVKYLLKCAKTIDKLSISLLGSGGKVVQTCLNAGIACEQVKAGDPTCLTKARAKCAKGFTKLRDPLKGTVAKLAAKFLKACRTQKDFDIDDFTESYGLGFGSQLARCSALGANDPAGCFGAQAFCEGAQIIERQIPRAHELADFLNVDLQGF